MGLISRQARSATIKAEADSVLYALSLDAYQRIPRKSRPQPGSYDLCHRGHGRSAQFRQQGHGRAAPLIRSRRIAADRQICDRHKRGFSICCQDVSASHIFELFHFKKIKTLSFA
jgi:hypothetical protein